MAQSFLPPHPHLDKLTKEFESQPKLSLGQMYDAFCVPDQKDNKRGITATFSIIDDPVLPENGNSGQIIIRAAKSCKELGKNLAKHFDVPQTPENGFLHVSQTEGNTDVFRNGQHNMPAGKRQKLEELIAKIAGDTEQPCNKYEAQLLNDLQTDEPVLIEYDDSPPQPPEIRREKVGGVTYMLTHSQVRALQKEARRMEANNATGTTKTI